MGGRSEERRDASTKTWRAVVENHLGAISATAVGKMVPIIFPGPLLLARIGPQSLQWCSGSMCGSRKGSESGSQKGSWLSRVQFLEVVGVVLM